MQRSLIAWVLLFVLGLVLIVAGISGNGGQLIAVVFVPDMLEVTE